MQAQNVVQKGIDLLPMVSDSPAVSQAASGFQDLLNAVNTVQDNLPSSGANTTQSAPEPTSYVPASTANNQSSYGSGSSVREASGQGGIWEPVASYSSAETARARQASAAADDSSTSEDTPPLSTETPIERFLRTLREQGIDIERMVLRPSERERLQELLEASGFKSDVARQIIDRSCDDNGNISISQLMQVLGQYTPSDGPLFTISPEDRPLLVQFLTELGMDTASVNQYLDSLPTTADGRIQVRGLGELLENAGELAREVDLERLGAFLGRLGMSNQDISSLLLLNSEADGKLTPSGALEIFKAVSSRQSLAAGGQSADNISTLLQRVQVESPQIDNFNEAQMKATVNQNLRDSLPDPAPDTDLDQDLDQSAQDEFMRQAREKLQAAEHQGEAGGRSGARSEALHNSVAQAASEAEGGAGQRGQSLDPALAAAIRAQAKGRAQGVENQTRQETGTTGLPPGQTQAAGAPAAAGGVRSSLPAYVARQVGTQMAQMIKQGDQVLRLSLKPPELGGVKMELSVEQSVIKASLTVDTVTAKTTLEAGLEQLRHNLAQQGFKVERIEVSVSPENQDQQQQAQAGGQGSSGRGRGAASGSGLGRESGDESSAMAPETAADALARGDAGRISLFA